MNGKVQAFAMLSSVGAISDDTHSAWFDFVY